ncbi:MAG: ferritin-like domain-containing protein [Lentisphaeria bacterium]|nr:ferritin-like domain-containing protein [Lentisphaeria bacterium]
MEIREFAEKILMSRNLDEKFFQPSEFTDTDPYGFSVVPELPGRPDFLIPEDKQARQSVPSIDRLNSDEDRGKLIHFLANHELLAVELMALVLLKFPDAPEQFRRGVLHTLKEEQEHTKIYMKRMKELGVEFGSQPVNAFFWKVISQMESPLDYVSLLSLTFEQANLDYSQYYAYVFNEAGDTSTGQILYDIFEDEVRHVKYGLNWFRKWKSPELSDWQAYRNQLRFPMSPARAKGLGTLNSLGRERAGLDLNFIQNLDVFSQSKGRPPTVYIFNPLSEFHQLRKTQVTPKAIHQNFIKDCALLPIPLVSNDDVMLVPEKPSLAFMQKLKNIGFSLPEFVQFDVYKKPIEKLLGDRLIGKLVPWSAGPELRSIKNSIPQLDEIKLTSPCLFSKVFSNILSLKLNKVFPEFQDFLTPNKHQGKVVSHIEEVPQVVQFYLDQGFENICYKAPLGAFGQQIFKCYNEPDSITIKRCANIISESGSIIIEPWLNKVLDFSALYDYKNGQLKHRYFTRIENDINGQYKGSIAGKFLHGVPKDILRFFYAAGHSNKSLLNFYKLDLREPIEKHLQSMLFEGPLGIDAFIYEHNSNYYLRPIVELNPRFTMGRIAGELAEHCLSGRVLRMSMLTLKEVRELGYENLNSYAQDKEKTFPLKTRKHPSLQWDEGCFFMTDPSKADNLLVQITIERLKA